MCKFVYKNYIEGIPFISSNRFLKAINALIEKYNIDFIFPAHDSVALELSKSSKNNTLKCPVITSSYETNRICRSKRKTYSLFRNIIQTSNILELQNIKEHDFPVFLKPDVGQGSKGAYKINNRQELNFYYNNNLLILKYLPGKEYTVDCFTNYKGELLFSSGRERRRTSNGISVNTVSCNDSRFLAIAKKINNTLQLQGMWFFQVKEDENGTLALMEIAPRVAGTMGYHRSKGVNLPLLAFFDKQKIDVAVFENDYSLEMDRALGNKYKLNLDFDNVYIDLDDTVIIDGKVNTEIIALLYQFKNENKNIYLITAHKERFNESVGIFLDRYCIDQKLFNKIINVSLQEDKSKFIRDDNSIFIDDSFSKRKDVFHALKIPVFDVCSIRQLLR